MGNFISSFLPTLFDWLMQNTIHISIIFGIVLLIERLHAKRSASFHYWLWLTIFLTVLIPPSIKVIIPQTEVTTLLNNITFINTSSSTAISPDMTGPKEIMILKLILSIGWLAIASGILLYTLIRNTFFTPHFSKCISLDPHELPNNVRDKVAVPIYVIRNYSSPVTAGLFKQMIFIPQFMIKWPSDRLAAVIAHELAHVRRHDNLIHLIQLVILSLYFFHPLIWIAYFISTTYREQAADEFAQQAGISQDSLIDALATTVQKSRHQPIIFSHFGHFFNTKTQLKIRIVRLSEESYDKNLSKKNKSQRVILFSILLLPLLFSLDISCSSSMKTGNLNLTESNLQPNTGAIIGEIYDQVADKPISDASITVYEMGRITGSESGHFRGAWERSAIFEQTHTNKQGYYNIKNIPYDSYIFEVILPDSQDISQVINIEASNRIRDMNYAIMTIPERPGWESVAGRKTLVPVMSNDPKRFPGNEMKDISND